MPESPGTLKKGLKNVVPVAEINAGRDQKPHFIVVLITQIFLGGNNWILPPSTDVVHWV